MSNPHGSKKAMDFELDLLPVISMMSVCICFLLLTAVWTNIGALEINQGLGQESTRSEAEQKTPSLWISARDGGEVTVQMMDSPATPKALLKKSFGLDASGMTALLNHANELKRYEPSLKTALIMAEPKVNYGSVVRLMDRLKGINIAEIGIAPRSSYDSF
jgi:biopolymer transport protein TolR